MAYAYVVIDVYKEPVFVSEIETVTFELGINDQIFFILPDVEPEENLESIKMLVTPGCNEVVSFDEASRTVRVEEADDLDEYKGAVCSMPVLLVDTKGTVHTYELVVELVCGVDHCVEENFN